MVASEQDGAWAYQHGDASGSIRQTTDATGAVQSATDYDPFGVVIRAVGQTAGSFGYAHEQHDAASGLTFLRARYYDPTTGRFLTRDTYPAYAPIPQTLHCYAYVKNNPVNHTDPSGLCFITCDLFDDLRRGAERAGRWLGARFSDFGQRVSRGFRDLDARVTQTARQVGQRVQQGARDWGRDVGRRVKDFVRDPVGSQARGLQESHRSVKDFARRKAEEVTWTVREMGKAAERGEVEGVFAALGTGILRVGGIADSPVLRNTVVGLMLEFNYSVDVFHSGWSVLQAPHATAEARRAAGLQMLYATGNVMTFGGLEQTRQGVEQGDVLMALSGAFQTVAPLGKAVPWLGNAAKWANATDLMLAGREVVGGLASGNRAQWEQGLFMGVANVGQMLPGMPRPLRQDSPAGFLSELGEPRAAWLAGAAGDTLDNLPRSVRGMLAEVGEPEVVRQALQKWNNPRASYADKVKAEQVLRGNGVPGLWQGGLPAKPPSGWLSRKTPNLDALPNLGAKRGKLLGHGVEKNVYSRSSDCPLLTFWARQNTEDPWASGKSLYSRNGW